MSTFRTPRTAAEVREDLGLIADLRAAGVAIKARFRAGRGGYGLPAAAEDRQRANATAPNCGRKVRRGHKVTRRIAEAARADLAYC